jgi:hypothetical protein
MEKMLDHGETRVIQTKAKPSPFISAAGLVLGVGTSVLRLVARGIKGAAGLLVNNRPSPSSQAKLSDEKYVQRLSDKDFRA